MIRAVRISSSKKVERMDRLFDVLFSFSGTKSTTMLMMQISQQLKTFMKLIYLHFIHQLKFMFSQTVVFTMASSYFLLPFS